jgi:hypothetical protein
MRDVTDLGSTLSKIAPLMRRIIAEAISRGAIGAVDDPGATGMFDSWDSLFVLVKPIALDGDCDVKRAHILTGLTV